jgi:hypothetical protein
VIGALGSLPSRELTWAAVAATPFGTPVASVLLALAGLASFASATDPFSVAAVRLVSGGGWRGFWLTAACGCGEGLSIAGRSRPLLTAAGVVGAASTRATGCGLGAAPFATAWLALGFFALGNEPSDVGCAATAAGFGV